MQVNIANNTNCHQLDKTFLSPETKIKGRKKIIVLCFSEKVKERGSKWEAMGCMQTTGHIHSGRSLRTHHTSMNVTSGKGHIRVTGMELS